MFSLIFISVIYLEGNLVFVFAFLYAYFLIFCHMQVILWRALATKVNIIYACIMGGGGCLSRIVLGLNFTVVVYLLTFGWGLLRAQGSILAMFGGPEYGAGGSNLGGHKQGKCLPSFGNCIQKKKETT